jgi:hypothetical protein
MHPRLKLRGRGLIARSIATAGLAAGAALLAVSAAACVPARTVPTAIVVVVTPTPTAAPSATDTITPTPSPTSSPTIAPTPVVVGSPTASPVDPPSAGPSSSPSPVSAATAAPSTVCAGTASNKSFWARVAKNLSWAVYCPVLPAGWAVKSGTYDAGSPGDVLITYAGPGGATLRIQEGGYCVTGAATCAPHISEITTASIGDLGGTLDAVAGGFAIFVNPGTRLAYAITGTGLGQDAFVAIAAAMVRVAR